MLILVYEYLCGGGTYGEPNSPLPGGTLLQEGMAMLSAVAADLAAREDVEVAVLLDQRLQQVELPECRTIRVGSSREEQAALTALARDADWTLLIAPEMDDALTARCRLVETARGRLLGPDSRLVHIASDKQQTAERLAIAGVPVAAELPLQGSLPFPAVLKPRFGAGSHEVQLLERGTRLPADVSNAHWRLERFYPGLPASISFLCGPNGIFPLVPCRQHLSNDGRFRYLGGSLPLLPHLAERATHLATSAVEALGCRCGYIGIDLVLGDEEDGTGDIVIEVNPRLTTSYVGLRVASRCNLAGCMLEVAAGCVPALSMDRKPLEFTAGGQLVVSTRIHT